VNRVAIRRTVGRQPRERGVDVRAGLDHSPGIGEGGLLHLGAAIAYEDYRDPGSLRFRDRPESRADGSGARPVSFLRRYLP
jgi:phosphate-selective porin